MARLLVDLERLSIVTGFKGCKSLGFVIGFLPRYFVGLDVRTVYLSTDEGFDAVNKAIERLWLECR